MIIPIGINHVIRGWPRVTIALIVACTLVQIYEDSVAPSTEDVQKYIAQKISELPPDASEATQQQYADDIESYANKIPSFRFGYRTDSGVSYRLVTCAFVHVGWLHLVGNMLFLWLAGAALEDRWGRARFGAFYLAGAVVSALGFAMMHGGSSVNLVGASGAVSALMGAFLVFFSRTQIHFVYWLGRGFGRFDAVAYIVLPLWLAEQVFYAWLEGGGGSVAFSAHIAGFAFGVAVALIAKVVGKPAEDSDEVVTEAVAVAASPVAAPPKAIARVSKPVIVEPPAPLAPPPRPVEPPKAEPDVEPGSGPRFLT